MTLVYRQTLSAIHRNEDSVSGSPRHPKRKSRLLGLHLGPFEIWSLSQALVRS